MAEATLKRSRDEEEQEETKRYKSLATSTSSPYNQILSFLEVEEEEPNQDLSSLITSLQQEISPEPGSEPLTEPTSEDSEPNNVYLASVDSSTTSFDDEEDKERVIKHLLEASDDELGIPTGEVSGDVEDDGINGGNLFDFAFCDGLWEFEDETANYYTLLQSELFM